MREAQTALGAKKCSLVQARRQGIALSGEHCFCSHLPATSTLITDRLKIHASHQSSEIEGIEPHGIEPLGVECDSSVGATIQSVIGVGQDQFVIVGFESIAVVEADHCDPVSTPVRP